MSNTESESKRDDVDIERLEAFREALETLVKNPEQFKKAAEAVEKRDGEAFQSVLSRVGILKYCKWVCRWYCFKIWGYSCTWLCPPIEKPTKPTVDEMLGFAEATLNLTKNKRAFKSLFEAFKRQDARRFQSILKEYKLERYCRQFCGWFAHFYCREICRLLCPTEPLITHIGRIPIAQFTGDNYANGPSTPPALTDAPNPAAGRGDHPFGGKTNIKGLLSIKNPKEYKIEYATDPLGPWTLIVANVPDFFPTPLQPYTRSPSAGWYRVPYTPGPPQDGMGNGSEGQTYLTDWDTPGGTGVYYLKLTVKNSMNFEFESPIVKVHIDNEKPKINEVTPGIELELSLKKPDGTVVPLKCCGEVKKGEGLVQIRFQAWDENFSKYNLDVRGACSLSIPIKEKDPVTGVLKPVSRTYGGNTTDEGEKAIREVLWDPWADPQIVKPCCYIVYLTIWDRAVVDNAWDSRHWNHAWTSIQIAV